MYTVMTVCTGNICRSPMAEIILRTEFERRGLPLTVFGVSMALERHPELTAAFKEQRPVTVGETITVVPDPTKAVAFDKATQRRLGA